mmetsp:Transcript_36380/g.87871  ORF Transcript_36380/g.87871 Transcript_36380/m.87871 type:complete len:134 (+) Transcript_36380:781-1182(+)
MLCQTTTTTTNQASPHSRLSFAFRQNKQTSKAQGERRGVSCKTDLVNFGQSFHAVIIIRSVSIHLLCHFLIWFIGERDQSNHKTTHTHIQQKEETLDPALNKNCNQPIARFLFFLSLTVRSPDPDFVLVLFIL